MQNLNFSTIFAPYFRLVSDKCMLPAHSPPPNCSCSTSQPQSASHSRTPSGNSKKHGHWEGRGEEREKRRRIQKEPKLMNLKNSASWCYARFADFALLLCSGDQKKVNKSHLTTKTSKYGLFETIFEVCGGSFKS